MAIEEQKIFGGDNFSPADKRCIILFDEEVVKKLEETSLNNGATLLESGTYWQWLCGQIITKPSIQFYTVGQSVEENNLPNGLAALSLQQNGGLVNSLLAIAQHFNIKNHDVWLVHKDSVICAEAKEAGFTVICAANNLFGKVLLEPKQNILDFMSIFVRRLTEKNREIDKSSIGDTDDTFLVRSPLGEQNDEINNFNWEHNIF